MRVPSRSSRPTASAIFSTNGVRVRNSVFVDNIATGNGGGGAIWAGSGGNPRFFGCTVVGNRATGQATGGIRSQGSTVTVAGSIVYDNEGQSGAQGSANQISSGLNVTYSIVEGGYAGNGNLSTDPGFVDVNAGDLRLAPGSPAIDAGNSGLFGAASPSDVAGLPREVDDPSTVDTGIGGAPIADIGAHEYQPPAFTPIAGCFGNTADGSLHPEHRPGHRASDGSLVRDEHDHRRRGPVLRRRAERRRERLRASPRCVRRDLPRTRAVPGDARIPPAHRW
ncbi:MAG: choice-of-anchor Q domain-containing protein [Planctomycetota bacterium]